MRSQGYLVLILVIVAALLIAGCAQQQSKTQPTGQPTAQPAMTTGQMQSSDSVMVTSSSLGTVLTDAKGMALYLFARDIPGNGTSTCSGACAAIWPVFSVNQVIVSPPLAQADFSSITRSDGNAQTTYKGWPLYYYAADAQPGDMKGDGVTGNWFVAKPDYTVMVSQQSGAGTFLTDGTGRTLYFFSKDMPGVSSCTGACLAKWPAFAGSPVVAPSILKPSDFSAGNRTDGMNQSLYMGMPLYYFSGDTMPGDMMGNGYNNLWHVANITGYVPPPPAPAIVPTPTTIPTTVSYMGGSSGGGGGGY